MTKREGFKSLAERLGRDCSSPNPDDLINAIDAMFTELREELCVAPSHAKPGKAYMEALLDQPGTHQAFASHGVGQGPASSERLAASQDELKSNPAKTSEPEVTEEMLAAAQEAYHARCNMALWTFAFNHAYAAARVLEPQRPVEITRDDIEHLLHHHVGSRLVGAGTENHGKPIVYITGIPAAADAIFAALATPPNEGETR